MLPGMLLCGALVAILLTAAECCAPKPVVIEQLIREQCTQSICRLPADEPNLRFLILGDWGGKRRPPLTTPNQLAVAKQLGKTAKSAKPHFLLNVGDNFYDGIKTDVNDKRFKMTFQNVYSHPSLQLPWYSMAGNHDYSGNITAQLAFARKSRRWIFPDFNYTIMFQLNEFSAKIIVIDTMILCGITSDPEHTEGEEEEADETDETMTQQESTDARIARQLLESLEDQLKHSANYDYVFVAGHYNIWGAKPDGIIPCMVNNVDPLLHKYAVSAYIAGHKHNLQHLEVSGTNQFDERTMHYIMSGAGARILTGQQKKLAMPTNRAVSLSHFFHGNRGTPGFVLADIGPTSGNFQYLDSDGTVLYNFSLAPRSVLK